MADVFAPPPFVTEPVKVTIVPVVKLPDASEGTPEVRSMVADALTVTVALPVGEVPPAPVHVIV